MQTLYTFSRRINLLRRPTKTFIYLFSSETKTQNPDESFLFNYLTETFNLPKQRAQSLSVKYKHINSLEKPQSVVDFLQTLGFSEAHIRSSVRVAPQILFSDIDRILKPKIEFFQQLGLEGSHLSKFISKNSDLLTASLEKKLIPNVAILKKMLVNDKNNEDLIRVISRCGWVVSKPRLLSNIEYLESRGIVGSQLSMLLKRQPRLFTVEESKLRELVSRTLGMGFSVNSRMLVHGLYSVSCISEETLERKSQLLRSFGFSKDECMDMFRRTPGLLRRSEEKLKLGLELYLCKMLIKREVLFGKPTCLMHSIEDRVIPRYKVLQILKSKGLLKKEPSFIKVLMLNEAEFLEKFVVKFRDDADELLVAYKGHLLGSYSSSASLEKEDSEERESQ